MADLNLRKVSVESEALMGYDPSSIHLSTKCGSLPFARIMLHAGAKEGESGVRSMPDYQEIIGHCREYQERVFSDTNANVTIKVEDNVLEKTLKSGVGNSIEFKGLLTSPEFAVNAGQMNFSAGVVHEDVLMQSFSPAPYSYTGKFAEGQAAIGAIGGLIDVLLAEKAQNNLAKNLAAIVEEIYTNKKWRPNELSHSGDAKGKFVQRLHLSNADSIDKCLSFLNRSTNTELTVDADPNSTTIDESILNASGKWLLDPNVFVEWCVTNFLASSNFHEFIVNRVCSEFMLEFVCQLDSEGAHMEHFKHNHLSYKEADLELQAISFNLASGYQRALGQVGIVADQGKVYGKGATTTDAAGKPVSSSGWHLDAYPNASELEKGKISIISAPSWLRFKATQADNIIYNINFPDTGGRHPVKQADKQIKNINKIHSEADLRQLEIYAQKNYNYLALSNATAGVVIPLNVAWGSESSYPVGRRYDVYTTKSENRIFLFSGFLFSVDHSIDLPADGTDGLARTNLTFTHIKSPGFVLPADR
jgi:hypothetical protein